MKNDMRRLWGQCGRCVHLKKNENLPFTLGVFLEIVLNMRIVDMSTHYVVKTGVAWPFSSTPNCKKMIGQLERNEALVTWICPTHGDIKDQIPAIRVKDNFYTMSLRMMKVRVILFLFSKNNRTKLLLTCCSSRPFGGLF